MDPSVVLSHRRAFVERVRSLRSSIEVDHQRSLSNIPPHCRSVLRSISDRGASPMLLQILLTEVQYPDLQVCSDLLNGFPLVGDIPVNHLAQPGTVQSASLDAASLSEDQGLFKKLRYRALSIRDPILHDQVIEQTSEEILAGRMGPLIIDHDTSVVTRRFPVLQRSSKGKMKVRIIDDFKESGINSTCSIEGRIRMGSISNLIEVAHRMWRNQPTIRLHIGKSDFSKAYRSCPIRSDHLPFANCLMYPWLFTHIPTMGHAIWSSCRSIRMGSSRRSHLDHHPEIFSSTCRSICG